MLVLTRRQDEKIYIGDDVVVTVCQISPGRVRIGIEAPQQVNIKRAELGVEAEQPALSPQRHSAPTLAAKET